ncbi:PREDICTED: disintegrin and metalloproteinase domain-containing protein 1b-like [Dipodomys ordii]|uniref:Disintegrin and metalloproteinase domain-containing protein 1b-like n=1 Tax=Dipodomys ordii TaxID=10020 RepID=A0A1S3FPR3_DIPOR|nr:PREDICTED: disintegrin and metalloproteinase domain-containing protein 1b-like [Dipodomys ordii]XP_012878549.1 PREDICTED: disintegrin and metalloproteinase domain-containing protein 1b-like [Dipodomys ordii]
MSVVTSPRISASILPSLCKRQVTLEAVEVMFQTWAPQTKGLRPEFAPGHRCVRLATMLLLGVILLPSMHCDLESVHGSSHEIVIPEQLTVKRGEGLVQTVSYMLFIQGQKQLVHLKVKTDYSVSGFPIYSYQRGVLEQAVPWISQDCHYEGYIEGVPHSFVSVNTCSGLRGILITEEASYRIEPMPSSQRFEHVLYATAHQAPASCRVASTHSQVLPTGRQQDSREPHHLQGLSYLWTHTKYVEMFVVVNYQRFQMWGSNINDTVQGVLDIIALANSFTRGLNTKVVLAGVEIWTEGDLVEVPVDLQVALRNFNSWRRDKLLHRVRHDVAHMIVGHHPGQSMGQAFLDGACSSGFAAAVESFHHKDVLLFAALMVHELGHNLGIQHDHSACSCKGKHLCLMHENITQGSAFSNCSSDSFYRFLLGHKGACLFNKPQRRSRKHRSARCGNGVIEESEQCDCGDSCEQNQCCDTNCHLKKNAKCSNEPCCSRCQFRKKGFLCRALIGLCDLPEYCDGASAMCPADRYMEDGSVCNKNFYCRSGHCMDYNGQCTFVFGNSSRSASKELYIKMNRRGDRFGHCGRVPGPPESYIKCSEENVQCGKLVCVGITVMPKITASQTLIQIPYRQAFYWSMDGFQNTGVRDEGDVWLGTLCGKKKTCQNYNCIHSNIIRPTCNVEKMCNSKGVCNNLKHCHCLVGSAPPDCKGRGNGGSVDSGPPADPKESLELAQNAKKRTNTLQNLKLVVVITVMTLAIIGITVGLVYIIKGGEREVEEPEEEEEEETYPKTPKEHQEAPTEIPKKIPREEVPSEESFEELPPEATEEQIELELEQDEI